MQEQTSDQPPCEKHKRLCDEEPVTLVSPLLSTESNKPLSFDIYAHLHPLQMMPQPALSHAKSKSDSHLNAGFHARSGGVVQAAVFLVVRGVDVGRLVLAVVELRPRPSQRHLEALRPPPLVFVRPRQPRLQRRLGGQDLGSHAEEVQGGLVVHVPFVGVPVFVQEEGSGGRGGEKCFKIRFVTIIIVDTFI